MAKKKKSLWRTVTIYILFGMIAVVMYEFIRYLLGLFKVYLQGAGVQNILIQNLIIIGIAIVALLMLGYSFVKHSEKS